MSDECTCAKCNTKRNRTAAFGAIRRALQHARDWEAFGGDGDPIRQAIRAAIGSPKA